MNFKVLHRIRHVDRPFYITLACLTVGYLIAIAFLSPSELVGDEPRYQWYAQNLVEGSYVPADRPDFSHGPGYPVLLAPFVALDAPWWMPRLLNAFFLGGALWFFYQTARRFVSPRWSLIGAVVMGLNPVLLRYLHHAKPEVLCVLFACAFVWAMSHVLESTKMEWRWIAVAAGSLFALMMTQVLFGYAVTAALVAILAYCFLRDRKDRMWQAVAPLSVALALCMPYLAYTYHHTGEVFKWSTTEGENWYWMTSPHEGEWGTWVALEELKARPEMAANHEAFAASVGALPYAQQPRAWREEAMANLREHPEAFAKNVAANGSRMLFAFPRSYYYERLTTLCWIVPGMFMVFLGALALYPTKKVWYQIPTYIKVYGLIGLFYAGACLFVPAEPRMLLPVVPAALLWMTFIYGRIIKVSMAQTWNKQEGPVSHSCKEWLDEAA